ncbi:MAG: gliding motility-associated C-terminal domain-containing protein [Cytophagaceae bacterium]
MRRFLLVFFAIIFFTLSFTSQASHIVGGEFELGYTGRGNSYNLFLKLYFDEKNADPGLLDADTRITVGVFRKRDNAMMGTVEMIRDNGVRVKYQSEECQAQLAGILVTRLFKYRATINLDPSSFSDPQGYYVVWERCCRNRVIVNIKNPDMVGQTFYMEFPPVAISGQRFINTSPQFGDIVADYFCLNKPNMFDFSAKDPDGDSLVYTLVTPLKGNSGPTVGTHTPYPMPAPYALIEWQNGYGINNVIPGNPTLAIGKHTGFLHVTPSQKGLYVLSVICEEFRDGKRIGLVRRDFQFLVDDCKDNLPPSVTVSNPPPGLFMGDTLVLYLNEEKTFNLSISDKSTTVLGEKQIITIKGISTNLPSNIFSPPKSQVIQPGEDSIKTSFSFFPCDRLLIEKDSLYSLSIVVADNSCPRPMTDTLDLKVLIKIPQNNKPVINYIPLSGSFTVIPGEKLDVLVYATDEDTKDIISITGFGRGFLLGEMGMSFTNVEGKDSIASIFSWVPNCDHYKNSLEYQIVFKVKDNSCIFTHFDYDTLIIRLENRETNLPEISPVNLITPNKDDKNDYFEIRNMPPDNCNFFFKHIRIFNRWGAMVFESDKRDFRWNAAGAPEGVYFYTIDLNEKIIKGWVHVMR